MAIDPKTFPIKGVGQTTLEQALKYVQGVQKGEAYVREAFRVAKEAGYNPEVSIAQWSLETGKGTSTHWINKNNPGGIGVTDGGDLGYSWPTPESAAQAQSVHLSAYVDGYNRGLRRYLDTDPRYLLVLKTDWAGTVVNVQDLTGKWATDPQYGVKIGRRIDELRSVSTPAPGPQPGTIVFGRVPKPSWTDRQIPDSQNIAWDRLGNRQLRGVVYHRQVGTNWGTDGWFRTLWYTDNRGITQKGGGQLGLTDFGIDRNTGQILQWNDYRGLGRSGISPHRSGWASGPWENPPGDGRAFVQAFGKGAINRDLVSLEIDGWYDSPIAQAGFNSIIGLSAYLADQAKVPWTDYPFNPATGVVFTYTHDEFQNHKPCPGEVVLGHIPAIIAQTREVLRTYQTGVV